MTLPKDSGFVCTLCGRPKGEPHSPRCSVTKWNVAPVYYRAEEPFPPRVPHVPGEAT